MKNIVPTLLLLFILVNQSFADNTIAEPLRIAGVENPVCIAISHDGLKMLIVDWPKRGQPMMKQANRPYIESSWSSADGVEVINKFIKPGMRVDAPFFSHDGECLFFSASFANTKGGMDIYYCLKVGDKWSEPKNFGAPVNTEADENNPSLSGNNREFFFTRNILMRRLEDYQTGEIWKCDVDSTNYSWQLPQKLDKIINNGGIRYPKICDDNKTFFFSKIMDDKSKWQLFWAKRVGKIHWYLPIGIDTLNSKESDMCPAFCKQDSYMYYIVNKANDLKPECSLFRYRIEEAFKPDPTIFLTGKVLNRKTNTPVGAYLVVNDPIMGDVNFFTQSDTQTGEWKMLLNAGEKYMFHSWSNNYSHFYKLFDEELTNKDLRSDVLLFDKIEFVLNIYDEEELWPLDGSISVENNGNVLLNLEILPLEKGKQKIILPIGFDYRIRVEAKDYFDNSIEMPLSNVVLYDKFERDIELRPVKRDLKIVVVDDESGEPVDASVEIINKGREEKFFPEKTSGEKGSYSILLREGEYYDVNVRGAQGYAFRHVEIDLDKDRELKILTIKLKQLKRKVTIRLNNINFEYNSADLLESSFEELNRVVQLVNDNPDIKLEIMAHTDDLGSEKYNDVLAQKRAQSVVDYMVINKIDSKRLVSKGFGESMPLVPNTSDENRALNRRVEMRILDLNDNEINEIEK